LLPRTGHFAHCLNLIRDIPGAIVECGVANGGSLATLGVLADTITPGRTLIGYDSFTGLPGRRTPNADPQAQLNTAHRTLQISGLTATLIPGYFEDTLPSYPGNPIALLHLDVDLGESYTVALNALYPHVSPGGLVLFDEHYIASKPCSPTKWLDAAPAIDTYLRDKVFDEITTGYLLKRVIRVVGLKALGCSCGDSTEER